MAELNAQNDMAGLVGAAVEIAKRRSALLDRVKKAVLSSDNGTAIELMKKYVGLTDEKSNRVN